MEKRKEEFDWMHVFAILLPLVGVAGILYCIYWFYSSIFGLLEKLIDKI